jgi:hypothetical protein
MGRPTTYSQELADKICERLIDGESLRRISKRPGMPNASTVCRWLAAHEDFREQYARAREAQADTLADEALYIADTPKVGVIVRTKSELLPSAQLDGEEASAPGPPVLTLVESRTVKEDMVAHRRLQVDTRKWYAAKLHPKKYGEKLELGGEIGLKDVSDTPLSEDEWSSEHAPG